MKTKFEIFTLNEAKKIPELSFSFCNDLKKFEMEAGEKLVEIMKEKLVGRIVSFHSHSWMDMTFRARSMSDHDMIMKIEDVIYRYDLKGPYSTPYIVKSFDRKHYLYYDLWIEKYYSFFYIDSFMDNFNEKFLGEEITFTAFSARKEYAKDKVKGIPVKIEIKQDALWQADELQVTMENGEKKLIDYTKDIMTSGMIKMRKLSDPYDEENW